MVRPSCYMNARDSIESADILSADFQDDLPIDHNAIIEAGGTPNTTFLAYHTNDKRVSFGEFYNRVHPDKPNARF